MQATHDVFRSIDGVVEVGVTAGPSPKRWLLAEVPHGATRTQDYEAVARQLEGVLPAELIAFFYVNTDIGAPEAAQFLAAELGRGELGVVVWRCLIPRTFIDTNRVLAPASAPRGQVVDGLTPAVPGYVEHEGDRAKLEALARRYHDATQRAYAQVCGQGGLAVQLHSYAPKSVSIERTDGSIVQTLKAAYEPAKYATWPERPAVDLICATQDGSFEAAPQLVTQVQAAYAAAGIDAKRNGTYHLHPATMGMAYAKAYPTQVLCVELNRGLVADPFVPFGVSPISESKVARMTGPIATVLAGALAAPRA